MPTLKVSGATLNYQLSGHGPLLLLISGANGEHGIYQGLARALEDEYTVLTYDRRGFSQSSLTGAQDYAHRLQTDADDVERLIAQEGREQAATVFGSSSGAIVALQTLISYPEVVKTLIAHEPPALKLLPDGEELIQYQNGCYQLYREAGLIPARQKFAESAAPIDRAAMGAGGERGPFAQANATYWFERELLVYPNTNFDLETLKHSKDQLIMGGGKQSDNSFAYRGAVAFAEQLDVPLAYFTGGHVGYAMQPQEFVEDLRTALAEK